MLEVAAELKALRLYGMAGAWTDLSTQSNAGLDTSRWLVIPPFLGDFRSRTMRPWPAAVSG